MLVTGARHAVRVSLDGPTTISRLRLWNYNASRAHAQRGARELEMRLDGHLIFSGEVRLNAELIAELIPE